MLFINNSVGCTKEASGKNRFKTVNFNLSTQHGFFFNKSHCFTIRIKKSKRNRYSNEKKGALKNLE